MNERILLVEDDPLVLRTLQAVLKRERYKCDAYLKPEDAIAAARDGKFDLIISDIRMPGKNGVEAMKSIKEKFKNSSKKDVPIVFITGYADDAVLLNAEGLGEVVLKPFDLDRFLMTIREYL